MFIFDRLEKRIFAFLISVSVIVCCSPCAYGVTQSEIDSVKEKRDAVASEKKVQQQVIDELAVARDDVISQKVALEENVALANQQIAYNDQMINMYSQMISDKQLEVEAALEVELEQLDRFRTRVRAMEENGQLNILAIILNANDLGELLTCMDDVGEIMQSDSKLEQQYIAAREEHERIKSEYEVFKADLEIKQNELLDEKAVLEKEISSAQVKINELQQQINDNHDLLKEIEDRFNKLTGQISDMEAQLAAQKAAAAAPGSLSGLAGFIWPCGTFYITSRAGMRVHPITGQTRYHSGMDAGSNYGDPVWAAADGTVSCAGWKSGYGNCVMIDHPNGYTTLYGHLSSMTVSEGQNVSQGSVIGYSGSTGLSTGPHLHFEIRSGGVCLDPEAFFGTGSFKFSDSCGE